MQLSIFKSILEYKSVSLKKQNKTPCYPYWYVVDLSQYLGHILVETAKTFSLFLNLQTPVELSNESNYGFDYDYKILQCS
ncbi:hypothetical protein EGCR1_18520 (plasmid) [Enterococcus gilvus]|nr:hypothetical protein EGCR1_18520 [Enterococcus gilvus]